MKRISTSICLGLGDNIVARIIFDSIKHEYEAIRITHDKHIMNVYKRNDYGYNRFLMEIGILLFTEPPYFFDINASYPPIHTLHTIQQLPQRASKPNLQHLLCRGAPLDINEEYIVVTTKIRALSKRKFLPLSIQLWKTLRQLSERYKIVIMGEREVEKNFEYSHMPEDLVYGIYDQIISNIPSERVVDLTVPALGNTAPTLSKIQQDGLIMARAKFVITLGLGGNVWLAVTTGKNIIGFRAYEDSDSAADLLLGPNFSNVDITKSWADFINKLKGHL